MINDLQKIVYLLQKGIDNAHSLSSLSCPLFRGNVKSEIKVDLFWHCNCYVFGSCHTFVEVVRKLPIFAIALINRQIYKN